MGNAWVKCFMARLTISPRTHPRKITATRYTLARRGLITKDMNMAQIKVAGARMHIRRII